MSDKNLEHESGLGDDEQESEFMAQAGQARGGLASEFVDFLKDNKKWWLAPIIVSILGLRAVTSDRMPAEHRPGRAMLALSWVGIVMLGGTAAAPFIYTLF